MAKRFHLFPFRTQQLSSFAPTILGLLDLGKLVNAGFFLFMKKGVSNETPFFVIFILFAMYLLTIKPDLWYNKIVLIDTVGPLAQLVRATGS